MGIWTTPKPKKGINGHEYLNHKTGIYAIRLRSTKEIVYIGMSKSCVYKALYHHFNKWVDPTCRRVSYQNIDDYEIRTILVDKWLVDYIERRLIKFFKPRDNAMLYLNDNDIPIPKYLTGEFNYEKVEECCPY